MLYFFFLFIKKSYTCTLNLWWNDCHKIQLICLFFLFVCLFVCVLCLSRLRFEHPIFRLRGERSSTLHHRSGDTVDIIPISIGVIFWNRTKIAKITENQLAFIIFKNKLFSVCLFISVSIQLIRITYQYKWTLMYKI